jgi:hypothetical protein
MSGIKIIGDPAEREGNRSDPTFLPLLSQLDMEVPPERLGQGLFQRKVPCPQNGSTRSQLPEKNML